MVRLLLWAEPYLAWGTERLESGSPAGLVLALVAGLVLGLTPATYPMLPAVVGYVVGEGGSGGGRAFGLGVAFAAGVALVYTALGFVFGVAGLAFMTLLNRSIWLWYGLLAPVVGLMGLRALGVVSFGVPMLPVPKGTGARGRGLAGAFLLGVPFGLAGCPTCALILPSVLTAVAASGNPLLGALALLGLGIGQGAVLVAAAVAGGRVLASGWFHRYRVFVEKGLGVVLILSAAYFAWRALLWL
ncbi:cytochrome c biogenesis CcdA family protein [Rubrobacter xylanophilus]|nr:cytochrome c biogenesis protein CcdA [Rubrobacter xylanophilus]